MIRVRLSLMVGAIVLASACAEKSVESAMAVVAAPVVAEETMHPQAGEMVGSREGHGEHSYDAPPMESLGGSFSLVEATSGRAFTDADLKGGWALVYFGYMECLEACPIALKTMPVAIDRLKAAGVPVKAVFVDINAPRLDDMTGGVAHGGGHVAAMPVSSHAHDGEAKTGPEIRREVIAEWGPQAAPGMIFLSGTRKELAVAVRAFQSRIEAAMLKNDEPIHHINHTTNIYVLDPQGRVRGVVYHSDSAKVMTDTVLAMTKTAPVSAPAAAGHSTH
ncbi:MAG: SCO family protein [Hyphomonadaceae bacterium]